MAIQPLIMVTPVRFFGGYACAYKAQSSGFVKKGIPLVCDWNMSQF